jgi:hypothetical protein
VCPDKTYVNAEGLLDEDVAYRRNELVRHRIVQHATVYWHVDEPIAGTGYRRGRESSLYILCGATTD